jgi:HTH-type transcriptional regulator/antitoxin HigA
MNTLGFEIQNQLPMISPYLAIRTEAEYEQRVELMNQLVDEVGDDPEHPLYRVIETLAVLIEAYDDEHHALPDVSGADTLKFLLAQHDLKQSDIPEVGSQGVISDILRGQRRINARQARALGERFGVPAGVFL